MGRRLAVLLSAVMVASATLLAQEASWEWPLSQPTVSENYLGNSVFPTGEPGVPPVLHGMRLASPDNTVRPVGPGRPVYIAEAGEGGINSFASPLGGVVALSHPGGVRSIYGHIEPVSPYGADPSRSLGILDGSGAQLGRSMFLSLYDERLRRSLNPRLLLPELTDRFRPVILELRLYAVDDGRLLWSSARDDRLVSDGTVRVATRVYDRQSLTDRVAPYRVTLFANGAQIGDFHWDTREKRQLNPSARGRQRYIEVVATNVTLVNGSNTLEVVARDFRGNSEERVFTVRRDPRR
ncbi:MAG: hypothetical protein ACOC45_02250 [Alkalispirochaetaceae bacterium]